MTGEPALPRLRRKCRRRSGARATPRWSAERRTSRLRGTGTPRKREVASYWRDEQGGTPPGAPPAPHFGVGAAADAKDSGASPPKRRHMQRRDAVETKKNEATTRAQTKCAAGTRWAACQVTRRAV